MSEVIETRGKYRAVLHPDLVSYDMKPDGDFFGYVFYMERGRFDLEAKAHSAPEEDFNLDSAWIHFGDMDLIARYLRMFWDVVGVDWFDTREGKYVNVVTRKDLEIWGWDPDDPESWPKNDDGTTRTPTQGNLDEWQAWSEGDVWYWTIEKRVHWSTDDPDLDDRDTWEEVDSCHGYYGDEYARVRALEELDTYQRRSRPNANPILARMRDDFGDSDEWGTAMAWAFGVAEVLHAAGENVPSELGFRPSPFVHIATTQPEEYPDAMVWDMLHGSEATVEDLQFAGRCLHRYLDWLRAAGKDY